MTVTCLGDVCDSSCTSLYGRTKTAASVPSSLWPRFYGWLALWLMARWLQTKMPFLFLDIIYRFGRELCVMEKKEAKTLVIKGKKEVYFASSPFLCSLVWLLLPYPLFCQLTIVIVRPPIAFSSIYQNSSQIPNNSKDIRNYNSNRENVQLFFAFLLF